MKPTIALLLLAAALPLYFVNLGGSSIWDANEAFYVETPREMIQRGDLIVPFFNFEPRVNKPVLSYWMVAGLYRLFGMSVEVQRFGIAAGGLIVIACAFCLGWATCDRRRLTAGLLAAAGLAVDPRLVMFSRRIFIDVWTTAFMALTLTFFVLSGRFPERRRLLLVLMYVSAGLGFLTKGPVAILLPALVFALYGAFSRGAPRLRDMMIPAGALIVLAIVLPWYVALYQRAGWSYIAPFFISENVGRYMSGVGFEQSRGPFFYLPVVFADGFPLSLFLVPAGILWRRDRRAGTSAASHLLWLWILVIVLFFSLSHDKQDLYILPIAPAVAALGAAAIVRRDEVPGSVLGATVVLGLLVAGGGAAVVYVFEMLRPVYALDGALPVGIVAGGGGLVAIALALRRRVEGAIAWALATLLVVNWLVVVRILSDLEQHKPVPVLASFLTSRISTQDRLSTYNIALPSLVYYLQRRIDVHYTPQPFVADAGAGQRMFGILSEGDYAALRGQIGRETCVLLRVPAFELKLKQILGRAAPPNLVLITNQCNGR